MFRLHKWFFDCVTPQGEALVVYVATLRWGIVRLGYSATLSHRGGGTRSRTRIGRAPAPQRLDDGFALTVPRLDLRGTWRGALRSQARELWRSPRGVVTWNCHLPSAEVEVQFAGRRLLGTGYVEHLALEVAPWFLPIDELRWGRWHGGGRSVVWIQWRGPHPLRLCLVDGEPVEAGPVEDEGFDLGDGMQLRLGAGTVLRTGELGRTVLAEHVLRWLPLPRAVKNMQETKWLARGTLIDGDATIDGAALHEVVRWA
ncbi:MAG: hypothetical protein H6838_13665 [Planctomycetes bacterium]|nr:hypothetical protein [Planctomycetota bacterium]MCB9886536.1 hypothetical protein [Planctomycetota bacterium]